MCATLATILEFVDYPRECGSYIRYMDEVADRGTGGTWHTFHPSPLELEGYHAIIVCLNNIIQPTVS